MGKTAIAATLAVLAIFWTSQVRAQEKSMAEKLLDVLRANQQITEQQYKELLKEAKAEKDAAKADREAARADREAARKDREAARADLEAAKEARAEPAEKGERAEQAAKAQKAPKVDTVEKVEQAEKVKTVSGPQDLKAYWNNGLYFESRDKDFKIHLGTLIQVDAAVMQANSAMQQGFASSLQPANPNASTDSLNNHGAEFRRARMQFDGTIFEDFEFKAEYDFAQNVITFDDVYLGLKNIPYLGRVRVGRQKEPLSLEQLTSDRWTTFMERSLADCFTPGRNIGALVSNTQLNERMTWALGGFEQTVSNGVGSGFTISHGADMNMTGRVTGLPWYQDDGRKLLHVGMGYSHKFRDPENTSSSAQVRFSSKPESHLFPVNTVDTKPISAVSGVDLVNPEAALVFGPFSLQGEYMAAFVDRMAKNAKFWGWYVYASYLLTGESRPYNKSFGVFDRVIPRQNFSLKRGGWGAWEATCRISHINLNDTGAGIFGGEETNYTLGINWFLNPCIKVMFNYVHADLENRDNVTPNISDGLADIFESRFQVTF